MKSHVSWSRTHDIEHLGNCCNKKAKFLVVYDGRPTKNYSVYICEFHSTVEPFNKNIIQTNRFDEIG